MGARLTESGALESRISQLSRTSDGDWHFGNPVY